MLQLGYIIRKHKISIIDCVVGPHFLISTSIDEFQHMDFWSTAWKKETSVWQRTENMQTQQRDTLTQNRTKDLLPVRRRS